MKCEETEKLKVKRIGASLEGIDIGGVWFDRRGGEA
jgi:hypothetical protein